MQVAKHEPPMTDNSEIWEAAHSFIERYGQTAAREAGQRADELQAAGERDSSSLWRAIAVAITEIQAREDGEDSA